MHINIHIAKGTLLIEQFDYVGSRILCNFFGTLFAYSFGFPEYVHIIYIYIYIYFGATFAIKAFWIKF